ncbi:MAG: 4Fe-4S dicluster domain-containing protein [Planctomycetaceae bacterium]|jgi:MauM/NapG family ferredoxin protein|nr:4Fe-4S dicluster domain-containing protein [Planctomycetaceae bacterium]
MRYYYKILIFLGIILLLILGWYCPLVTAYPMAVSPLLISIQLSGFALLMALFLVFFCFVKHRILCQTLCPLGFCFRTISKIQNNIVGTKQLLPSFVTFPKSGIFLAIFTWLGSLIGVTGFLWLDPFVLFSSPFRGLSPLLPVFVILLIVSCFVPSFWCRHFCPLGGTQDLLYIPNTIFHRRSKIRLLERRNFLWFGWFSLKLLFFGILFELSRRCTQKNIASIPIRPPGAVQEKLFLSRCTRCGACVQACPTSLLKTQYFETSILDYGTPYAVFDPAWCNTQCTKCGQVCPSGALQKILPAEKKNVKLGLAVLTFEDCRLYDDRECSICGRECPFEAITFEWSESEYRKIPIIDTEKCTGCGYCVVSCPVEHNQTKPLRIVTASTSCSHLTNVLLCYDLYEG